MRGVCGEIKKYNCAECSFYDIVASCLNKSIIRELCAHKEELFFTKGEIITREKEKIFNFKYLRSGIVKFYRNKPSGEEQIITITRPFGFISNMNIFSEEEYQYSISALENSTVCAIDLNFIKRLCLEHGKFAMALLTKISMLGNEIISRTLDIKQRNLTGRVAYVLLSFANDIYNSNIFNVPVSRQEIADYIGMSAANVIRTLSSFKKEGIITINGKTIEIVDINRLEMIAKRG